MKILNNFLGKVGTDKALHFAFGGWALSAVSPFGVGAIGVAFLIVMVLSFVKELFLDDYPDPLDIVAAFLGCLVSFACYIPVILN